MNDVSIRMTDSVEESEKALILDPLVKYNEKFVASDYRPLAIFVSEKDAETGAEKVVGGVWAASYYGGMFLDVLFLPEKMRGTGLGTRLMKQMEDEAVRRGCHLIWVDTFSFQARGFYEKQGFSVFGTIEDFPRGQSRYFLVKRLGK